MAGWELQRLYRPQEQRRRRFESLGGGVADGAGQICAPTWPPYRCGGVAAPSRRRDQGSVWPVWRRRASSRVSSARSTTIGVASVAATNRLQASVCSPVRGGHRSGSTGRLGWRRRPDRDDAVLPVRRRSGAAFRFWTGFLPGTVWSHEACCVPLHRRRCLRLPLTAASPGCGSPWLWLPDTGFTVTTTRLPTAVRPPVPRRRHRWTAYTRLLTPISGL